MKLLHLFCKVLSDVSQCILYHPLLLALLPYLALRGTVVVSARWHGKVDPHSLLHCLILRLIVGDFSLKLLDAALVTLPFQVDDPLSLCFQQVFLHLDLFRPLTHLIQGVDHLATHERGKTQAKREVQTCLSESRSHHGYTFLTHLILIKLIV